MKEFKYIWVVGLVVTFLIITLPIALLVSGEEKVNNDPWANVPQAPPHTDHTYLMEGPLETGPDVTRACLECHETAAAEMMQTEHWTWESEPLMLPGRDEVVTVGKKNQLNNFCIGIQGNWKSCTTCHAGYGYEDNDFDFSNADNVDCLVCHADPAYYGKGDYGYPAEGADLLAAAQSVNRPSRLTCGSCHFNGGGGNAVKHGDLDESLYFPNENIDVHMGRHDFVCVDCHRAEEHRIAGYIISNSPEAHDQVSCESCHTGTFHNDERINRHLTAVACQTCHIPEGAVREATKMDWDWSTAGQDLPIDDPHVYLKIKGSFVYEDRFVPEYAWFNGNGGRYIKGDIIDPQQLTVLSWPVGGIGDPEAKIWPFKVHFARQPYDTVYGYLLIPNTAGEGGFWSDFDWDQAFRTNVANTGLAYSGQYDFASTTMYWTLTHMVQPKEKALQCTDCHGQNGVMDWEALGYFGDPMRWGGRALQVGAQASAPGK
jgi:octaheme c-type cytochrome (tetrathionate reductase family)